MEIAPAGPMGVATDINFQPTGGGKAAITGDFVLAAEEVQGVVKELRAAGIDVTAIHSHMAEALADPTVQSKLALIGQDIFPREQQNPRGLDAHQKAEIANGGR